MQFVRDQNYIAGFWASEIEPEVPELHMVGEAWYPTGWNIRTHTHTHHQFYLQLTGRQAWTVETEVIQLEPGDLLITKPNTIRYTSEAAKETGSFVFCIVDCDKTSGKSSNLDIEFECKNALKISNAQALHVTMQKIAHEAVREAPFRAEILKNLLTLFFSEVSRSIAYQNGESVKFSQFMHPAISRACDFIQKNYHKHCTVTSLAKKVNLTPNHFSHLFSKEVGISPTHYLKKLRIAKAIDLLENTDMNITQIALEVGFTTSQHFSREFKSITSKRASEYRKKSL